MVSKHFNSSTDMLQNFCIYENVSSAWPQPVPNCQSGYKPLTDLVIHAEDQDSHPQLLIEISWEDSTAKKDGQLVNSSFYDYTACFDAEVIATDLTSADAILNLGKSHL